MRDVISEWVAEFFDDVKPLMPGGGEGGGGRGAAAGHQPPGSGSGSGGAAALQVPLAELAAGMRTPAHMVPAVAPRSVPLGSPRPSPRSSFINREGVGTSPTPQSTAAGVAQQLRASSRGSR